MNSNTTQVVSFANSDLASSEAVAIVKKKKGAAAAAPNPILWAVGGALLPGYCEPCSRVHL